MGNLSKELSSWRKQIVTCKSGIITTIDFMDTRPNIMFIMNPTEATLLASIDHSPTPKNYDFKIKEHYTRLIGKPTRTRQCYIYNDSSIDCDVQVYSLYDEKFDPSWIKDFNIENVNISNETLEAIKKMITGKVTIEGVKDGVILPVYDGDMNNRIMRLLANESYSGFVNLKTLLLAINAINDCVNNVSSYVNETATNMMYLRSIYKYLTYTTYYKALANLTPITLIKGSSIIIKHIIGNGTLRITESGNNYDYPINGFMNGITYQTKEGATVSYIKPTDEIENAHILYKIIT